MIYIILGSLLVSGITIAIAKFSSSRYKLQIQYLKGVIETRKSVIDNQTKTIKELMVNRDKAIAQYKKNLAIKDVSILELKRIIALSAAYLEDAQKIDKETKSQIVKIQKIRSEKENLNVEELTDEEIDIINAATARLSAVYSKLQKP